METTELATVADKSLEVHHMKTSRLDDSLFSKELAPHYMQLAGKLASSALVPKSFQNKPQDLFICWAMGYQIGVSPEQAMQCIAVINGRPAMWGDDMLALCMAHKEFDDIIEKPVTATDGTVIGYHCTVKRKGKEPKTNEFTLAMAKKAGLLGKPGPWTQYPERMLKLRARGFTLRDAFPDALKGIKSREEVEDYIDAEYKITEPITGSRTEALKKDFLTKIGREENEVIQSSVDLLDSTQAIENDEPQSVGSIREQETVLHTEVLRLLDEKGFDEARIEKALAYYEADSIEALPIDLAEHFIGTLNKL